MDEADDPDPDGWPIHPAAAFYGLWPRFAPDGEDAADGGGESTAGLAE